jgi:3-dehydroquinate synthase
MRTIRVRLPANSRKSVITIGSGLLEKAGPEVRKRLPGARIAALVSNQTVFQFYGEPVMRSLRRAGFTVKPFLLQDGERHKSFRSLERAVNFLATSGLQRSDVVLALGGGVVGDLAGFAASIYLRGIPFVQIPTTLLAQIDSSVGGKTGINLPSGKNLAGAFHQPELVLIDTETLATLPPRELTSGFCEMVKQGAVGGRKLFDQTIQLLRDVGTHASGVQHAGGMRTELAATIAAHCRFKASVVAGDEREDVSRSDGRSRRVLNFGHTTAHALEKATKYRRFRHGEAVGYGILVAAEISKSLGMLPPGELESVREAVGLCGRLPRANDLSSAQIIAAMAADKKAVQGKLKWVLLERIGRPRIVDSSDIKSSVLRAALAAGLKQTSHE